MSDKPIEPSVEALRAWLARGEYSYPTSDAAQALAAYDQLKAENEALKAQPLPVAVLDQIANLQEQIDNLKTVLVECVEALETAAEPCLNGHPEDCECCKGDSSEIAETALTHAKALLKEGSNE